LILNAVDGVRELSTTADQSQAGGILVAVHDSRARH
jgi:hypothetical protein